MELIARWGQRVGWGEKVVIYAKNDSAFSSEWLKQLMKSVPEMKNNSSYEKFSFGYMWDEAVALGNTSIQGEWHMGGCKTSESMTVVRPRSCGGVELLWLLASWCLPDSTMICCRNHWNQMFTSWFIKLTGNPFKSGGKRWSHATVFSLHSASMHDLQDLTSCFLYKLSFIYPSPFDLASHMSSWLLLLLFHYLPWCAHGNRRWVKR